MRSLPIERVLGAALATALLAACGGGHGGTLPASRTAPQSATRHVRDAGSGASCRYGLLVTDQQRGSISLGSGSSVAGDVGAAGQLALAAGAVVQGTAHVLSSTQVQLASGATVGGRSVDPAGLAAAADQAGTTSGHDAALAANVAGPGAISLKNGDTLTVSGTNAVNVLDVSSIELKNGSVLTLSAPKGGSFVVNVAGAARLHHGASIAVAGGLSAGNVTINFTGAQGDVQLQADSSLAGTILAPARPSVTLDHGAVVGGSIVAGGSIGLGDTTTVQDACPAPVIAGTFTEFAANGEPFGIVSGPDGALWFTEYGNKSIARMDTSGALTEYRLPAMEYHDPYLIAAGPDGALWFTDVVSGNIGRITTAGAITQYPLPGPNATASSGIAAGPDGAMWFIDNSANAVGRITMSGAISEYPLPPGSAIADGIALGPDGAMWFVERSAIGRITMSGAISEFSAGMTPNRSTFGIAAGPDGAMWFTEEIGGLGPTNDGPGAIGRITMNGTITEFSAGISSSAYAHPSAIVQGPDGAMWFTETGGNALGRIATDGTITELALPTPGNTPSGSVPGGITVGPDGALWFTEELGPKIGRLH